MISRRQFCEAVGAAVVSTCLPGAPYADPAIRVVGIGGAGCNIVEKLHIRHSLGPSVTTITVDRADAPSLANWKIASGIDEPLSETDARRMTGAVRHADRVIVVTGVGGKTGTALTPHFIEAAAVAEVKSTGVLILPDFETAQRSEVAIKANELGHAFGCCAYIWNGRRPTRGGSLERQDDAAIDAILAEIRVFTRAYHHGRGFS